MTDTIESRWESHNEAGRRYFAQGDYAKAEQAFIAAIREATALGAENVRLASSLSNLGQLKYKQKDLTQAEALFRRSLAIRERVLGPDHFGLVQNINNLAALHYARGELEQAEPLFRRALAISETHLGDAHPDVAVTLNNLARLYFRRSDYKAAAPLLMRLLTIKQEALSANHPEVAAILTSLAKVRYAEGDYDAGEQLARRALAVREKIHAATDPAIATTLDTLAEICGARGKHAEEIQLRERALSIRESAMGADHPTVTAARTSIAQRRASIETMQVSESSGEFPKVDLVTPASSSPIRPESSTGPIARPHQPGPDVPAQAASASVNGGRRSGQEVLPSQVGIAALASSAAPSSGNVAGSTSAAAPAALPVQAPAAAAASSEATAGAANPTTEPSPATVVPTPPARRPEGTTGPISAPKATTRSVSLPWIEPPTSPALRPPWARQAPATESMSASSAGATLSTAPTPPPSTYAPPAVAREKVAEIPAVLDSPFKVESTAESSGIYAQLLGGTPAHGTPAHEEGASDDSTTAVLDADPLADPDASIALGEPRREVSLDWPLESSRNWVKLVGVAATVAALAIGGWLAMGRSSGSGAQSAATAPSASKSESPADVPPSVAEAAKPAGAIIQDSAAASGSTSIADGGVSSRPTPSRSVSAPELPSARAAHASTVSEEASRTTPATPKPADDPPPDVALPPLQKGALPIPAVNKVDAITQMIDDSARRRADSVEHTIPVKPPTFKSPREGPSSPR